MIPPIYMLWEGCFYGKNIEREDSPFYNFESIDRFISDNRCIFTDTGGTYVQNGAWREHSGRRNSHYIYSFLLSGRLYYGESSENKEIYLGYVLGEHMLEFEMPWMD